MIRFLLAKLKFMTKSEEEVPMKFAYLIEPPFNFRDLSGYITGCDVELARAILMDIGMDNVQFVETDFASLIPGLAEGRWQMTTGLFKTPERATKVRFTQPIWALPDGLLLRKSNGLNIQGYGSIAGDQSLRLAVVSDQIQHQTALDCGIDQRQISVYKDYESAAAAVRGSDVDAFASVARAHSGFIHMLSVHDLTCVPIRGEEKRPAFGAFAVHVNDEDFAKNLDLSLSRYLGSIAHRDIMAGFGFSPDDINLLFMQNA